MVTFKQLWENHPTITREGNPCDSSLDDQCAMKLGTAFSKSGIKIQGVEQCWFAGHKGQGHYLRAEELAHGLRRSIIPGIQPVREFSGIAFKAHILGTTGIFFLRTTGEERIPSQESKNLLGTEAGTILIFGVVPDLQSGGRGLE